ncbi:hypothetical protein Tco_0716234 [Tanacetum coccineum]
MDLFAFIRHSDPTKVRVGERNLAEREVKLLKMTEGHTVSFGPSVTAASGDSNVSIDSLFDEGNDVGQEHSVEKDDDVLEEAIAKDALEFIAEKPQKKQKRKVAGDASGSAYPPKKLRGDYQSLPPNTSGKSLVVLRGIIPEGFDLASGVTEPLIISRDELNSKMASLESKRDCLATKKSSLESAFELFRGHIKALQDEQTKALGDKSPENLQALGQAIGCAVNKGIQDGLKAGIDHGKARRDLDHLGRITLAFSVELMLPIHRPKDNVVFAKTSLSSSLKIVNLWVQRFREEAKEKRLSLTDVMTPFVEPLSSKSLTGEASTFVAPITTLSTTFASSAVIPPSSVASDQVLDAEPHNEDPPVVTFEKEELGTSPK